MRLKFWTILLCATLICGMQSQAHAQTVATTKSLKHPLDIEVKSAEVKEGVLTLWFHPQTTTVIHSEYNLATAYYVSNKKQYKPLEMGSNIFASELYPDMKKDFWIKFPAPEGNAPTIDLYLPDIAPVEKLTITYK